MHPFTFLACTYNLWGTYLWDERRPSLEQFFSVNQPDVLCIQELTSDAGDLIRSTLPVIRCVDDPFPGWTTEGNIFWNSDLFELEEYGAEDIGMPEERRRLFWVRLTTDGGTTIVVSTVHFTQTGNDREINDHINLRIGQAEAAVVALDALTRPNEPTLLMGDLNDYIHPLNVLRSAGLDDSFGALGRVTPVTYPARPIAKQPPELLDWMMHRGAIHPTLTSVVDFYFEETPPSDHKPILTTYQLVPNP